ncbi:hypothetical protein PLESTM_001915800 [Pleodorina starrii]|nr:hypothetical protein PLESTM_001915800 [Pleodorina starrii]
MYGYDSPTFRNEAAWSFHRQPQPCQRPAHTLPLAHRQAMGRHFDPLLLAAGITERALRPTAPWRPRRNPLHVVKPLHVVTKADGDIRPVIDPSASGVNACMDPLPCPLPDLSTILHDLPPNGYLGKRLPGPAVSTTAACWTTEVGAELGLEWKASKDRGRDQPLQQLHFLGMLFDTVRMESEVPLRELQSVIGGLTFIARAGMSSWGLQLAGKRVLVRCDKTQAVAAIISTGGASRLPDSRTISRRIAELAVRHGF